jgi:hypothetical protein
MEPPARHVYAQHLGKGALERCEAHATFRAQIGRRRLETRPNATRRSFRRQRRLNGLLASGADPFVQRVADDFRELLCQIHYAVQG